MDLYSRMVAIFKVLLPLAALALLSTLFLLSRSIDPTATIPFSQQDVSERVRGQQVTEPFFSGTTADGDDIVVHAALARPGGPESPAEAETITARIIMADGVRIVLGARRASVDMASDIATFSGDVRVSSTDGLVVRTEELVAALGKVEGRTTGVVRGTGPMGRFDAGRMEYAAKNRGEPLHMVFKDGVKLIYQPKQPEN